MYFPIVFSQYDPSFEDDNPESMGLNQIHSSTFDIDDSRGYWRFYGFGITSLYHSDLKRVGGMNLTIHGWGKEDVDLFDRYCYFILWLQLQFSESTSLILLSINIT